MDCGIGMHWFYHITIFIIIISILVIIMIGMHWVYHIIIIIISICLIIIIGIYWVYHIIIIYHYQFSYNHY